jgi:cell fate regulator YaaT (PSP1 superfamily)
MRDEPVAGIRLRNAGKILYFHTAGMRLEPGEYVVVETVRGPEIGKVVIAPDQVVVNEMGREELKPILRLATEDDLLRMDALRKRIEEEVLPAARELARQGGFPARIDAAEFTLDGRRLTFAFASEERLDYRDFLRRAGERFSARVDMRQIGARDRAKLAGGYGICGRELCCSNWLTTFPSISIRMAKEQELPLNPQKISGLCGRLLCCLSYEEEGYKEMRQTLPRIGQRCSTPTGEGRVIAINILKHSVTLVVEGQRLEVPDRDLGLVVRWDPSSRTAEPPPSISRADAITQGLIEATEEDLREAELRDAPVDWITERPEAGRDQGPGRGRLPGGGPRREVRNRPPRPEASARPGAETPPPPASRPQPRPVERRGPREGGPPASPQGGPARTFRRSEDSPPPPPRPAPANPEPAEGEASPETPQGAGRRRGRRGGRGRGGPRPASEG